LNKYKHISNNLMLTEKEYAEIIYMYVSIRGSRAACGQYHSLCDFFLNWWRTILVHPDNGCQIQEKFEDTKGVIIEAVTRTRTDHKMDNERGQKDKQWSTKHYTKNLRSSITKHWGWTQVRRKGKQILLHAWQPSCYSCCKPCDKSWMRKGCDELFCID